ncbi:MAG: hypothetical protein ACK5MR_15470 [Cumulibacter sp.]
MSRGTTVDLRIRTVLAWVVVAIGTIAFHLAHLYSAIGLVVASAGETHDHEHDHDHGHDHLEAYAAYGEANSGEAWLLTAIVACMALAPLIVLVWRSRIAGVVTIVVGGLAAVGMLLDGFGHGLSASLGLALAAIALPLIVAIIVTVRWIGSLRSKDSVE